MVSDIVNWLPSLPPQQTEQEEVDDAAAKAKAKRASMVKKALRYFEDKSNRSMSEDNLFTRRKNLAVHLGLDEKVSLREIQKINTFSLPVPSSATPFNASTSTRWFVYICKLWSIRRHPKFPFTAAETLWSSKKNSKTPKRKKSRPKI